jgi:hypothetical protein
MDWQRRVEKERIGRPGKLFLGFGGFDLSSKAIRLNEFRNRHMAIVQTP